jgi:hypothetical protein
MLIMLLFWAISKIGFVNEVKNMFNFLFVCRAPTRELLHALCRDESQREIDDKRKGPVGQKLDQGPNWLGIIC